MASPSTNIPASRSRTKTSELSDFFRHTGPSSYHIPPQKEGSTLEVPSGDETSPKKKITRIPLFGRSRKKSNQSASSSPHATLATTTAAITRESSDVGESSSRVHSGTDRRPSAPSSASTRAPTLPLPSKVPSLSSKLAAHFSHSRLSKLTTAQAESDSVSLARQNPHSSGLAPPAPRSGSFESNSSVGTKARSITPQPSRPAITVSLSTDNDEDEFKDLFTRPGPSRNVEKVKKLEQSKNTTPPASPNTRTSETSIYRRGYTPASAIAAAVRHQQTSSNGSSNRPPSTSSKNSKRNSESDKSQDHQSGTSNSSTPRLSESRESPKLLGPEKERGLPPSLQRRSTVAIGSGHLSDSASSLRSRIKLSGSQPPSRPPSIPLPIPPRPSGPPPSAPLPPTPTSPSLPTPDSPNSPAPQYIQMVSENLRKTHIRPRAHTMGSTSDISISPTQLTKQADSASKPPPSPSLTVKESEHLDIENASVEDLRRALKARNKDCEELADLLVKNNDLRIAEVAALQRKVSELETTIKGLTFIINESGLQQQQSKLPPAGVLSRSRFAVNTDPNGSDIEENQKSSISGIARSRLGYQSDSGADTYPTSGCESIRASGSGPESLTSMFRNKKTRRQYPVNENAQIVQRSATMFRASKIPPAVNPEKNLPEIPSASFSMKRSSISSLYASPSSSTSSLLAPSPSITMSSLSAIPEGSGSTLPARLPRYEPSDQQDDRRVTRISQRTSTSSLASSTTAASSSYSSNVKRSRPPSIAQVLEVPNVETVLDKLRPFS